MTRILTSVLHLFLASTVLGVAVLLLAQFSLAVVWERGFYGQTSILTQAWGILTFLFFGFGALQTVGGAGWLFGRSWGGVALLVVSGFLVLATPPPLRWLVLAGGFSILVDFWVRGRRLQPEEAE